MAKLSLTTRKDIKEAESYLKENLKKIEDVTGILFDVEVDWLAFDAATTEDRIKNALGTVFYKEFLENFVGEVTKFCKDDLQKESFVEMFGTKKQIVFELYEAPSGSNRTRNDGGRLMLGTNKSNGWISGAYQIGKDLLTTCSGDAQLSISLRKNLRDFESHRVKNLGRISKAVGIDFELETPDFPSWFEVATPRNVHDDLGQMFYDWYLGGLADNLEKLCKDDMCKEAVAEACTKKMIKFVLGPKEQKGYGSCTFPDGVLVITLPPNNLPANVGELGKDIESQL